MGSRKESLKKALCISEYPWSSDDEESGGPSAGQGQDLRLLRRQSSEPRVSVGEWTGTSGVPGPSAPPAPPTAPAAPAPTPVRRNQSRVDRDLFWSALNRTNPILSRVQEPPISFSSLRAIPPSSASQYRERNRDRPNSLARSSVTDIQHILQAMSSRRTSSVTARNSLFNSSVSGRVGRSNAHFRRSNNRPFSTLPPYVRSASTSSLYPSEHRTSSLSRSRLPRPVCNQLLSLPPARDVANTEQLEENDQPQSVPNPVFPQTQENSSVIQENDEVSSHDTSTDSVALVSETADIDPPDDAEPSADAVNEATALETPNTSEGNAASPSGSRGARQGVKRKTDADEEILELATVTEFNQGLLRLLECPVCLEWMEPPISQCRRGHLVCSRCRARLASCPVCRTTFSSVRNRAMEGVAELLRYPCRHGCGREVRLRRRAPHEASCEARKYHCPAPACRDRTPLSHHHLPQHFESEHKSMLRSGQRNSFSLKVNTVQHVNWVINAHYEYFHLRADVDIRSWGVIVYVAYIGPKCNAKNYTYEVTVDGEHHSRRMVYTRATHSDLESSSFNVSLQDCFHLTVDQALNFLRFKTRHSEPEKYFEFDLEITECEPAPVPREESDS